jgi:hypothetical protein
LNAKDRHRNKNRNTEKGPGPDSDGGKLDAPRDKAMRTALERVHDPSYPSYDILLAIAEKLLNSFEKNKR